LPAISNTTLLLPEPNKSAEPKVLIISSGLSQSAYFKTVNQILKELLFLAFLSAKSSMDFRLISLIFMPDGVKVMKLHKK
jgi:hypothetical protein